MIALDHHRITHKIHGVSPERPGLTPAGRWVIAAKYGQPSDERTQVRATLAEQLATIIDTHPVYGDAFSVAAVPGRRHGFSGELAKDVCKKVNKEFVSLKPRDDFSQEDPHFEVDPSDAKNVSNVRGKSVVVVDDVYRSGRTLQAAATALYSSGATEVFGLTATCTISATAPHCAHDIAPPTTPDSEQS